MQSISKILGVSVNFIRGDRKYPQYRVRTSTIQTNQKLRNYLTNYPLLGTKFMDFQDWCKILKYFENNTHWENKEKIMEIKSQMNQNRKTFIWDHLSNMK